MKHILIVVVFALLFNGLFALPHKVNPEEIGGFFQGDMDIDPDMGDRIARNARVDEVYRWPNKTLVYELSSDFDAGQKDLIRTSLKDLAKYTCIKYKEHTNERDYVNVTGREVGCSSKVGRKGRQQRLNLNVGECLTPGIIMHEFMHALGFAHMQSAPDRDKYVLIKKENILAGYEQQFDKYPETVLTNFGLPYDYKSIMHYPKNLFSKNGRDTVVPLDSTATIGIRDKLSYSDIRKINIMYKCDCDNK